MKDKYGVELEVGDFVVVFDSDLEIFERGVIEDIEENKVMGLVVSERALVNFGKLCMFSESNIIYIGEWKKLKVLTLWRAFSSPFYCLK